MIISSMEQRMEFSISAICTRALTRGEEKPRVSQPTYLMAHKTSPSSVRGKTTTGLTPEFGGLNLQGNLPSQKKVTTTRNI